jgi:hypothetical protein
MPVQRYSRQSLSELIAQKFPAEAPEKIMAELESCTAVFPGETEWTVRIAIAMMSEGKPEALPALIEAASQNPYQFVLTCLKKHRLPEVDYSREIVKDFIKDLFPADDPESILNIVRGYVSHGGEDGSWRTRFAIVKLSRGDVGRLHHYVTMAQGDYRDVLMEAFY